jgi:hypothetical protein
MSRRKKNVLWLDIAVNYALAMGVSERVRDVTRDRACDANWELSFSIDSAAKRFARDVRHYVVEKRLDVARIMEREDIGMLEAGQQSDFPDEAQLTGFGIRVRVENLDRDFALVLQIARKVHRRECSLSNFAFNLVVSAERGTQRCDRIDGTSVRRGVGCAGRLEHSIRL